MSVTQLVKYQGFDGKVVEATNILKVVQAKMKSKRCRCKHPKIRDGMCFNGRCRHESCHHKV